jgi:hypothetical protein
VEKKIFEARVEGFSIGQLSQVDLITELLSALVDVSVITGHALPQEPVIAKRLTENLSNQLLDFGYQDLTTAEFVLAFRLNCLPNLRYPSGCDIEPIEIFGSFISVDYVTKVLNIYRTLRSILDRNLINIIDGYQL